MWPARAVSLLQAILLLLLVHGESRRLTQTGDVAALLALPAAIGNWGAATAVLAGAEWQRGTSPCGGDGSGGTESWKGVTCGEDGEVVELRLGGLGLEGTLPPQLAALRALTLLDLRANKLGSTVPAAWLQPAGFPSLGTAKLSSNLLQGALPAALVGLATRSISIAGNAFSGTLPPSWSSSSMEQLDVSNNELTGSLPASWGGRMGLPALDTLRLQGNNLSGLLPVPQWTYGAFARLATLEPRPGNTRLCGPVPPLDPSLYSSAAAPAQSSSDSTSLVLTERDLFTPGTSVTLTNWLGMCMTPCTADQLGKAPPWIEPAGLNWPPSIQTGAYDVAHVYNMSISDLLLLNPGLSAMKNGQNLSLPCYPTDKGPGPHMPYMGGNVAFGMFAGGNQLAGTEGLAGAMAAAQVVLNWPDRPPNQTQPQLGPYTGSLAPAAAGDTALVEPVYWFVDMLAPFQVVSVFLTAGSGGIKNASLYVGSNSSSVFGNTLVASGLDVQPGAQLSIAANATAGRYVVVYTGMASEGQMSLADVQVYSYETNAAVNKPLSASSLSNNRGGASITLQSLVDNNASTCVAVQADAGSPDNPTTAWVFVDLGYMAPVGAIAVAVGSATPPGLTASVHVSPHADDSPTDHPKCGADLALQPGSWAVGACNATGRYIALNIPTSSALVHITLCDIQVALALPPDLVDDSEWFEPTGSAGAATDGTASESSSGGSSSGGEVAGIVVGALAGAVLVLCAAILAVRYTRWRRQYIARQLSVAAALSGKDVVGSLPPDEKQRASGDGSSSISSLPGSTPPPPSSHTGSGSVPVSAFAAAAAVAASDVPLVGAGGAPPPPSGRGPRRSSEWEMMGEFARATLRRSRSNKDLASASSQASGAEQNASLFPRAATAGSGSLDAERDLTRLPPGLVDVAPKDIQLIECVGEGSFGQVWRARYYGAVVAVKIFGSRQSIAATTDASSSSAEGAASGGTEHSDLKREALLMSQLRHPNVCLYLGACESPPSLVMEYCQKRSLDVLLTLGCASPQVAEQLSWVRLLGMIHDAATGMLYLHTREPPIAHRDLKSANLLVDRNWQVKVADFNLSRSVERNKAASTVVMTNPRWLAPEVMAGTPGHLPADVWAFGTVMWELLTWQLPFTDLNTYQIISIVQREGGASLQAPPVEELRAGPFVGLQQYVELMHACRCTDPEGRPQFDTIAERLRAMLDAEMRRARAAAAVAAAAASTADAEEPRVVRSSNSGAAYNAMRAMLQQRQAAMLRQQRQQLDQPAPAPAANDSRSVMTSAFSNSSSSVPGRPPRPA